MFVLEKQNSRSNKSNLCWQPYQNNTAESIAIKPHRGLRPQPTSHLTHDINYKVYQEYEQNQNIEEHNVTKMETNTNLTKLKERKGTDQSPPTPSPNIYIYTRATCWINRAIITLLPVLVFLKFCWKNRIKANMEYIVLLKWIELNW